MKDTSSQIHMRVQRNSAFQIFDESYLREIDFITGEAVGAIRLLLKFQSHPVFVHSSMSSIRTITIDLIHRITNRNAFQNSNFSTFKIVYFHSLHSTLFTNLYRTEFSRDNRIHNGSNITFWFQIYKIFHLHAQKYEQ